MFLCSWGLELVMADESQTTVLDVTDSIQLTKEQASSFHNELVTLEASWRGLDYLYSQTRKAEKHYVGHDTTRVRMFVFGNVPGIPKHCLDLISCFFDWYAVSACNLGALIGWLGREAGCLPNTCKPSDYVRRVMPALKSHRDKVSAHYSRVSPQDDAKALQEASTMWKLALHDDRFVVNAMMLTRTEGGKRSDSSKLRPWSLTKTHEVLYHRYRLAPTGPVDLTGSQTPTSSKAGENDE